MRARLIFNPVATTTTAAVRDSLTGLLSSGLDLSVVATRARLHAADLAREAVGDGVDAVFALGGDGTANEVLQGLAGTDVALGVLPGGGANVLARALGLPRDARRAAADQLERLHAGADERLGLGEVNGRLFGFQAGLGFDAALVRRVEAHPRMKQALRQLAFVLLGLREWATSEDRRDPACLVEGVVGLAGVPRMMVSIANLDPYTYLGPRAFRLVPDAGPTTGLDLMVGDSVPTLRLLRAINRAFLDGSHDRDPAFAIAHDLHGFTVRSHRPVPLMTDGDIVDHVTEAHVRHRPGLLRVLTPPLRGVAARRDAA